MLISPDFVNSDYCYETETIRALERHHRKEALVIPIIIRPCLWSETPFKVIQALPTDGKPVTSYVNTDEAWLNIAEGLLKVVNEILEENQDEVSYIEEKEKSEKTELMSNETQVLLFLNEYKKYWFSPSKIKNMADKVEESKDLTSLDLENIIAYCESLTQKGKLNATLNAKGTKIYKINEGNADFYR